VGVTEDVLVRFIEGYDQLVDFWFHSEGGGSRVGRVAFAPLLIRRVAFAPLYSKYAFLGALRSAAQMVPYEVSIGLILIVRLVSAF